MSVLWEKAKEDAAKLVTELLEVEQTVKNFRQIEYHWSLAELEFSGGIQHRVTGV